ncbi:MAG: AAA family ATPase [Metamycoplasmataceae bacterium]
MKLIKVKAKGFKSFADEVNLHFDGGVAGIVGPNGSGKSNINDAIKWVLGEQSSKALRGDNMEDVIFAGSKTESQQNKAEVSLTFDNSENPISLPHKIFTITRILERGKGTNTYYINDTIVKYRDIREIALESGISKSSLAIISQGTVSDIAQSTPEQRRGIIEDAAGTSKYKSKKIESLRKLEKTTESLDKVRTVLRELEKQLIPLEKQSEKAKVFLAKSKELKEVEIALLVNDLTFFKEKLEELKEKLDGYQETQDDLKGKIKEEEILLEENTKYKFQIEQELNDETKKLDELNEKLHNLEVRFQNEEAKREMIIKGAQIVGKGEKIKIMKEQLEILSSKIKYSNDWDSKTKDDIKNRREELNEIEMSIAQNRLKVNSIKAKYLKAKTKIDVLNDHKENKTNLFKGTKTVLENQSLFKGMFGTVSDLIEIPEKYILAIEAVLQNALQHIVVDESNTAIKIIEFLKQNNGGRATFVPLTSISEKDIKPEYLMAINGQDGFISLASKLVSVKDPKFNVLISFLLGNIIVVEDIQSANKISHILNKKIMIVSLDGDLIRVGGIITGGAKLNSINLLGIDNQIKQLEEVVPKLEEIINHTNNEINKLENIKEEKQSFINELNIELVKNIEKHEVLTKSFLDLKLNFETISDSKFDTNNIQEVDMSLDELHSNKKIIQATIRSKREKVNALNDTINFSSINKKDYEKSLRIIYENFSEKINEKTKAEFYIETSNKRLTEWYHLTYESAKEKYILQMDIEEARKIVSELKTDIESLGNVNVEAIQMYEEIKERHDEIAKNESELEEAKNIILEAINEMDKIIINKINSTMEIVNIEFANVFKKMFGGGEARIFLLDPNDPLESGIDIQAQPPGKSVKNLKLFSGGEKALIAISLLFAIIKAKPLPLCILDEVEAALDESNVIRYAEYLQELKKDTQFIVITHRHGTMSRVDNLFGATMQKRGVTSFFSVELSKAKELIDNSMEE